MREYALNDFKNYNNDEIENMGVPLKSNIFKQGTSGQKYFARFPIQVAVLFSPNDLRFVEAFREIFLNLDQLTGDDVAFFAVLDPPEDWIDAASNWEWWREYQGHIGQAGFSYDDRVLIAEIARLFGIAWSSLPSIVVGTNLWTGERVIFPTSVCNLERQLEALTRLAREWGQPNIDHIYQTLSDLIGVEAEYHPPSEGLRDRFSQFYEVLGTPRGSEKFDVREYSRIVHKELELVANILDQLRQMRRDEELSLAISAIDQILEDVTGRLVAPATVAMQVLRNFLEAERDIPFTELLDEESVVMLKTALRVGSFLELDIDRFSDFLNPTQLSTQRPSQVPVNAPKKRHFNSVDFTPGAQGAWKAFELEINLSVIQAARAASNVTMPEFFARYDPNLRVRGRVHTGKGNHKDINQRDRHYPRVVRHRFLPLGDALYVIKAMPTHSPDFFDTVVSRCLQKPLPSHVFDAWKRINRIRNQASHTEPLSHKDYQLVLEDALSPDILRTLMQIKQSLST
ncbi:hypothetical protein QUA54_27735 [Microcoleus sp. MOSTC5]|uniref:hypothetical protein n=1 Tax=Microcoleus sp. MOSTC5 TaxID=3055378 RepID=UPI002FD7054D